MVLRAIGIAVALLVGAMIFEVAVDRSLVAAPAHRLNAGELNKAF